MDATLVLFGKDGQRKDIAIKAGMTIVGRRPDCDVRIPLPIISRKHCRISRKNDNLVIQDLGSANGTFVNNHPITESEIKAGDLLQVGPMKFVVQIDGKPRNILPPTTKPSSSKTSQPSAVSQLSGSQVSPKVSSSNPFDDSLADLDPGADAGLDDSFS